MPRFVDQANMGVKSHASAPLIAWSAYDFQTPVSHCQPQLRLFQSKARVTTTVSAAFLLLLSSLSLSWRLNRWVVTTFWVRQVSSDPCAGSDWVGSITNKILRSNKSIFTTNRQWERNTDTNLGGLDPASELTLSGESVRSVCSLLLEGECFFFFFLCFFLSFFLPPIKVSQRAPPVPVSKKVLDNTIQ